MGSVLLSLGPSSKISGPQFLPSFASSVLRSAAFSCQDQSIIISGYHGKQNLSKNLLSSLLSSLEEESASSSTVTMASELLECLTYTSGDLGARAVLVTTLVLNPKNLTLISARFFCLLLDTSQLRNFEVSFILEMFMSLTCSISYYRCLNVRMDCTEWSLTSRSWGWRL